MTTLSPSAILTDVEISHPTNKMLAAGYFQRARTALFAVISQLGSMMVVFMGIGGWVAPPEADPSVINYFYYLSGLAAVIGLIFIILPFVFGAYSADPPVKGLQPLSIKLRIFPSFLSIIAFLIMGFALWLYYDRDALSAAAMLTLLGLCFLILTAAQFIRAALELDIAIKFNASLAD